MQVYVQDVLCKLNEVNTSVFGQFIKMDSTKKTVRKLAGQVQVYSCLGNKLEHGMLPKSPASSFCGMSVTCNDSGQPSVHASY